MPPTLDAAGVDALIEQAPGRGQGQAPAGLTGDEEFVRRVYLDVAGNLPTPDDDPGLPPRQGATTSGPG